MKILVVDDLRTFSMEGFELTHARTVTDAVDRLLYEKWDVIYLDHDMGGEDTTIPVALVLRNQLNKDEDYDPLIYIHTMNPVGRKNLKMILPHARDYILYT